MPQPRPDPSNPPVVVWFRQDLRLADNPALAAAVGSGRPVVGLYILDEACGRAPGGATRWWLHHSLAALNTEWQRRCGQPLLLRHGDVRKLLPSLLRETGADTVHWNRCYDPASTTRDAALKQALKADGFNAESHNAALLFEPWTLRTQAGGWFRVFTPFWRACLAQPEPPMPLSAPKQWTAPLIGGEDLATWRLLPSRPDWAGGLRAAWAPGEAGAVERLTHFIDTALEGYAALRDRPDRDATSMLSPHLHFGEIGPRQIWHAVRHAAAARSGVARDAEKFLAELGWREFSNHLLFHFPDLPERNFRCDFDSFPWANNASALEDWQRGRTGYPIVDAGMRQLWQTGWMHNRVRMIVASFLVKHLRQDWRAGEAWFWDTLVDADAANNAASWQWVAGSGADAAPYFRIFNPILQGQKYDPDGDYVRRWVPELSRLPAAHMHKPWAAPAPVLQAAGVELGRTYPRPLVDHDAARAAALAAFAALRDRDKNEIKGAA